jgi:hypothetical protein
MRYWGQGPVDDEVGDADGRRYPQEDRLENGNEVVVGVGVEGIVDEAGLISHMEHRCDPMVDEGRPDGIVVAMRHGSTVDGCGGDHAETHAGGRQFAQLSHEPRRIPQGQVGHRMEVTAAVGHHGRTPPVPGGHVGRQGGKRL